MKMTFRMLKEQLDQLSQEQLDCDVSIYDSAICEFFEMKSPVGIATEDNDNDPACGILDAGHPYLSILCEDDEEN